MSLDDGVALPVADEAPIIDLSRTMLDAYSVRDLAEPSALGLGTVLAATLGLTEVPPEITALGLVIPDQRVDPLMTDADGRQGRHEAADLLWAPLLTQPVDNGGDHARQALRPLPSGAPAVIAEGLGPLRIVAIRDSVSAQLTADRAVVDAKLFGDLSLAHADTPLGVNLVSLGLGQLSVSHALLHFGR